MRVVVIGGGPAGMTAAIKAGQEGNEVYLLEKNNKLGKKLLITGKGRCNITSSLDMKDFIANVPGNGKFLFSAFDNYTNTDIIKFLEENGVSVKEERGNRIFPTSDKSIDVLNAFEKELKNQHIKIKFNAKVTNIAIEEINDEQQSKKVKSVLYVDENGEDKKLEADKIILATGGKTYPDTGSTGDGYDIVKKLGHTITDIRPSLVPLTTKQESLNICKSLQGLSLKNISIKLIDLNNNKTIYEDFGEMLFTHFGVSGPTILSSSAHLLRYKNVQELLKNNKIQLVIDLKPALSIEKLDLRIQRDFTENKNKEFKNSLNNLLPQKLINTIIELSKINPNKQVNEITKEERGRLVKLLKNFTINISGFRPIAEGIITAGGISVKEINPKTMESKLVKGLFFAGEIIDVDAYTGGFNLQIAYSTGYTAGCN
ncbi:MAG: NAD(P)/FAD-dependent oxidoreductase [Clostridia bacterium]